MYGICNIVSGKYCCVLLHIRMFYNIGQWPQSLKSIRMYAGSSVDRGCVIFVIQLPLYLIPTHYTPVIELQFWLYMMHYAPHIVVQGESRQLPAVFVVFWGQQQLGDETGVLWIPKVNLWQSWRLQSVAGKFIVCGQGSKSELFEQKSSFLLQDHLLNVSNIIERGGCPVWWCILLGLCLSILMICDWVQVQIVL